jgi:hypothetical protein
VPHRLSQRNHAADRDTAAIDGWHELQVANPTFLLERLGSECTGLQGLRELTVNGLDAIAAQGGAPGGRVVWDLDWQRFDASDGQVRKLSGDLEDQAARYHLNRHELTVNADFPAITDLITHWYERYRGVAGARTVIEAHVREWCEQILVEVVLSARSSSWSDEQLHALLSPTSFTAALLPRHLLHATLTKRLAQKLGAPRSDSGRGRSDARDVVGGHTASPSLPVSVEQGRHRRGTSP